MPTVGSTSADSKTLLRMSTVSWTPEWRRRDPQKFDGQIDAAFAKTA
jgi:hypothetical protein